MLVTSSESVERKMIEKLSFNKSLLYLLPVRSQPRFWKRVQKMQEAGVGAHCLYFDRNYHNTRYEYESSQCIGRLQHGNYASRMVVLMRSAFIVRRCLSHMDGLYAFGLDMALLGLLAKLGTGKPLVYEIGDIRKWQISDGIIGKLFRIVERWLVGRASVVVVTAQGYADEYYIRRIGTPSDKVRVIENRLTLSPEERPNRNFLQTRDTPRLAIGYFGLLRCRWSCETLKEIVLQANGRINVEIHGYPFGVDIENEVRGLAGIRFHGAYQSPDDLRDLYDSVDIVFACYPAPEDYGKAGNWVWARTNRFYESCYFKRPMIGLAKSDEGHVILKQAIGFVVEPGEPRNVAGKIIEALSQQGMSNWQANVASLPDEICVYTNEHENLVNAIWQ